MKARKRLKGNGEFIGFVIISLFVALFTILMVAYVQLYTSLVQVEKALSVAGRAAAICETIEDARMQAQAVAESSVTSPNIDNITVAVDLVERDGEWIGGNLVLVTITADIKTLEPYLSSGSRTKTTLITIENGERLSEDSDISFFLMRFCKENGCTNAGTAAILGIVQQESGFDPYCFDNDTVYPGTGEQYAAEINNGTLSINIAAYYYRAAFGLFQHTSSGRKYEYFTFCKLMNYPVGSVEGQCDFMLQECLRTAGSYYQLTGLFASSHTGAMTAWSAVTTSNDLSYCVNQFDRYYEVSRNSLIHGVASEKKHQYASQWLSIVNAKYPAG